MRELWRRVWYLLTRSRVERELRDEMQAHREMAGMSGAPRPRFGNTLRLREEARDQWGWAWLDHLSQDLRFGARLLWRTPAFTLTAIAVLALGVGLNLAAFQVIDTIALSWLPIRSPETLVNLYRRSPRGTSTTLSYPAFAFYRDNASTITGAMALVNGTVTLGADESRRVDASFVSANYFLELGAPPLAGRLLTLDDESASAGAVVVLSEGLWRSRFGGDASLIGRAVSVNGSLFTVIGIAPRAFVGIDDRAAAAWIPITQHALAFPGSTLTEDWASPSVRFFARVRSGVGPATAEAELASAVASLRALRPAEVSDEERLAVRPAGSYVSFDEIGAPFALISSLVGLVLVAACMNLSILVLARTLGRDREFAIRLSVGATRRRIVRQLLTEQLLLALLGAAAGCFVAGNAARVVLTITGAPAGLTPQFNTRTILAAVVLAAMSSVVFGFAPVWHTLRPVATRRRRLRNTLVGVQVAAATALLIVSSLLVRGVTRIVRVPLGFDYQQTLVANPDLASHGATPATAGAYWQRLEARVRQIPGVRNAALTTLPPFGNRVWVNSERTIIYQVTPAYFDTMRIALERGRIFENGEAGVAVISASLARRRWPGQDPIGGSYEDRTIIGVVGDARTVRISEQAAMECYFAIGPREMAEASLVVRVDGSARAAAATIRMTMRAEDGRLTPSVVLLRDALEDKLETPRQVAAMVSALGICALLLAVTGLGGMVAFTVSQRLREIGVRVALGARPSHIVGAIARQFTPAIVCGALAGSLLAAVAATILSRELFGVGRFDPLSHGGALLLFAAVAAVAALPSVRRALRVDPVATLRHE
jgi:predicted permease